MPEKLLASTQASTLATQDTFVFEISLAPFSLLTSSSFIDISSFRIETARYELVFFLVFFLVYGPVQPTNRKRTLARPRYAKCLFSFLRFFSHARFRLQ
jgi:hypothetical protein